MRKTKIICTIGPACESEEILREMINNGMNVARINFSHGSHEEHQIKIDRIKKLRREMKVPLAIMLDTKGPEYRIKCFENESVEVKDGDEFTFTTKDILGNEKIVSVNYDGLAKDLKVGDKVLVCNGLLEFEVVKTTDTDVICKTITGGVMSNKKSMSFPNKVLNQNYVSKQDREDIIFGIKNDVDYIACSFVSRKQDLLDIKSILNEFNRKDIELIAKIENRTGIDNIEDICSECSGVMIGRGDLGVEIPFEELPAIQKEIITKCRLLGKRVITATEMLESMIYNSRPTRAETSDIANAVYDGTSTIMLSGETAMGKHPVLAVKTMAKIAETTEKSIVYSERFKTNKFNIKNTIDAISHATCGMAIDIKASAVSVCTISGMTARMVSRFRSPVDIVAVTTDEKTYHKLAMSWGVTPVMTEKFNSIDVLFYSAKQLTKKALNLKSGDKIVITGGMTNGESGNTNVLKIEQI